MDSGWCGWGTEGWASRGSPDRKGWPQENSGRVSEVKSWHTAENDPASCDWGLNTEVQCGGRVRLKRERRS